MRRGAICGVLLAAALAALLAGAVTAVAAGGSLWASQPNSTRPGPAILYRTPATAPELTNAGVWKAAPILISGATAYRRGEFLYQDYLYDDHGAHETADPADPRANGDTFSKPNGTYTYPTGPGYANDAADLVEFRVKPLATATAFRITLNTLQNPALIAFSVAIGGSAGRAHPFPYGANVSAPANLFLTVHPVGRRLVASLTQAANGRLVRGPAPKVIVDTRRRQITVRIFHRQWNPRRHIVRLAMGIGLWDASVNRYLLPQTTASATRPGGAGLTPHPAAFFNVAFRTREPLPSATAGLAALTNAAWWRDRDQGQALAGNDISGLYAAVNFGKLARHATDNSKLPRTGAMDRILASHYEIAQGAQFAHECGFQGATQASTCVPEYEGQLQPYAIYVPPARSPAAGYGMTLLLHSLSANYNQYIGSRNQSQFANRSRPSIVITPEARGPDQFYEGYGSAEVFEAWADVARRYHLDPAYTDVTGYSMGGIGTFKLGAQFPDLFARAQPTVGDESNNDVLASMRNLPVLMWNNSGDELVNPAFYTATGSKLQSLGYRYELDVYEPCPASQHPTLCSPLFPNHLELAVNDQFAPAAAFLGSAVVNPNPAHVTYAADTARDRSNLGIVGDHAYWVSQVRLRSSSHTSSNGDPIGQIDAFSHGFGQGDPAAVTSVPGSGTLTGGNLGPLTYAYTAQTWSGTPAVAATDVIDVTATNVASAAIDVKRAHVDCHVTVNISTDGPTSISLPGCNRTVTGNSSSGVVPGPGVPGVGRPLPFPVPPPPLP